MNALAKELEPIKARARRHRSNMLKALAAKDVKLADEEFKLAAAAIDEGFALLKTYGEPQLDGGPAGKGETDVAEQRADLYGMSGGLRRSRGDESQGDFTAAVVAYDQGYGYEAADRFRILSSYNTVNRLILRILRDPRLLASEAVVPELGMSVRVALKRATGLIEGQLAKGRSDVPWALADLVLCELLEGEDAMSTLSELADSTPTDNYPLQSLLNVLRDLLKACRVEVPDVVSRLIGAGEWLRSRLPSTLQGPPLQ